MKKRILIFTPGGVGGAERMCVNYAKILLENGYDVQIVILGKLKNLYNIIPDNISVDCIAFRNKYCLSTLRIWWKIITSGCDIVFSSLVSFNPRVIIAAKLARKKLIIRSSGMVGDYGRWVYLKLRYTYPLADKLIAQQEDMRTEMSRMMKIPLEKIITLHNPIDKTNIDRLKMEKTPFKEKGYVNFVNIGRINKSKGQDILLKAFSIVKGEINNARLWYVGFFTDNDEFYKSIVSLKSNLGLNDSVFFVGYDKNPFKWVNNADCYVLSSRSEGLPNALVEASYIGTPCVASRCLNVVNDIIKDGYNGYTVPVGDVDQMATSMVKALTLKNFKMIYKPANTDDIINVFESVI